MPRQHYDKLPALRNRKGFYYVCEVCKKEFYVPPSRVTQAEKTGHPIRFCSLSCRTIAYHGEGNPMWGKTHSPEARAKMIVHPNRRRFDPSKDNPNYKRFGEKPHKKSTNRRWKKFLRAELGYCEHCGFSKYPSLLELHHVDCDKKNSGRENLKLLCPTCHEIAHYLGKTGKWRDRNNK